jgi:hypothetical protein
MSSCDEKNSHVRALYAAADAVAEPVKVVIQFLIGATLLVLIVFKGLAYLGLPVLAPRGDPLDIAGQGLMISAGVELAYMLFTEGPDEAVQPLILGLASAALITASYHPLSYEKAIIIGVLCLSISALFFVKHFHLKSPRQK